MEEHYEIVDQIDVDQSGGNLGELENHIIANKYKMCNKTENSVTPCQSKFYNKSSISPVKTLHTQNSIDLKQSLKQNMYASSIHNSSIIKTHSIDISSSLVSTKQSPRVKKSKTASISLMPKDSISFGERLYRKALALKEVKETRTKEVIIKKEEEIRKRYAFSPKLNEESCILSMRQRYESEYSMNRYATENNLSSNSISQFCTSNRKKRDLVSYQKQKEEQELKEMKPSKKKTNKEIEEITQKLYLEAETLKVVRQQEAIKVVSELCPFPPKIADSSKPKLENFYKRLQSWIEKRNDHYVKEIEQAKVDSKTGQPLFRPIIYRKKDDKAPQTRNIFIDLYEESKKISETKQEVQAKAAEEITKQANCRKATDKIEEIHITNKYESFIKLFEILDYDSDNLLSFNEDFKANLYKKLTEEIRKILEPLLNELSVHNESLNRDEFIMALDQLYNVLNVDQKRKLINWYVSNIKRENSPRKRREENASHRHNFSFHPTISGTSHQLFENSQKHSKDLLKRNVEFLKKKEEFIRTKLEEKKKNEVKGCTFRPNAN